MVGVVDFERKLIFVHIPKCAGTSISNVLLQSSGAKKFNQIQSLVSVVERDNAGPGTKIAQVGHARARQVREALGPATFDGMNSFAVVRNPWTLLVSRYQFLVHSLRGRLPDHLKGSFEDFVLWTCKHRPNTQFDRLSDTDGRILVRDVLAFENLQPEFHAYETRLFGRASGLPLSNQSVTRAAEFTDESIQAVRSAFGVDFEAFGYSELKHPF